MRCQVAVMSLSLMHSLGSGWLSFTNRSRGGDDAASKDNPAHLFEDISSRRRCAELCCFVGDNRDTAPSLRVRVRLCAV